MGNTLDPEILNVQIHGDRRQSLRHHVDPFACTEGVGGIKAHPNPGASRAFDIVAQGPRRKPVVILDSQNQIR